MQLRVPSALIFYKLEGDEIRRLQGDMRGVAGKAKYGLGNKIIQSSGLSRATVDCIKGKEGKGFGWAEKRLMQHTYIGAANRRSKGALRIAHGAFTVAVVVRGVDAAPADYHGRYDAARYRHDAIAALRQLANFTGEPLLGAGSVRAGMAEAEATAKRIETIRDIVDRIDGSEGDEPIDSVWKEEERFWELGKREKTADGGKKEPAL